MDEGAMKEEIICVLEGCNEPLSEEKIIHDAKYCSKRCKWKAKYRRKYGFGKLRRIYDGVKCKVEGCDNFAFARYMCQQHYNRWYRYGNPTHTPIITVKRHIGCAVENCNRKHWGRGYCHLHYSRWKKHGNPMVDLLPNFRLQRGCKIGGCENKHYGRGCCKKHYRQLPEIRNLRREYKRKYRDKMRERPYKSRTGLTFHPAIGSFFNRLEFDIEMQVRRLATTACVVIYQHAHDPLIQNDPEALGAEFIEEVVGIGCKKLKREKRMP